MGDYNEPWEQDEDNILDCNKLFILDDFSKDESAGKRAVLCVNACEGMSDDILRFLSVKKIKTLKSNLDDAIEHIKAYKELITDMCRSDMAEETEALLSKLDGGLHD